MILEKYSIGIGDRFSRQGKAQLEAIVRAKQDGLVVVPVWNKSHREHTIIGTTQANVRAEADAAVDALGWTGPYYVDADHITLDNVDGFIPSSDFFTLDVADHIDGDPGQVDVDAFLQRNRSYLNGLEIPGIDERFHITEQDVRQIARKFLCAVRQAGVLYRHIARVKGADPFVVEISIDETDQPQSPVELFFILAAIAQEEIPAQTIAPKFTGRFNKGVDYVGNASQFKKEFHEDLAVLAFAIEEFGMPSNLKLSIHSGSDKFSIYRPINRALKAFNAGVHLKTAGTTWLEELIGLAVAEGEGLAIAKEIYRQALDRLDELCAPYATVIDIDRTRLPTPDAVDHWDGQAFAAALRHDPACEAYNPNVRQILHVGYKIAAAMGDRYLGALSKYEATIAQNVTTNIYERHIKPVFMT